MGVNSWSIHLTSTINPPFSNLPNTPARSTCLNSYTPHPNSPHVGTQRLELGLWTVGNTRVVVNVRRRQLFENDWESFGVLIHCLGEQV